MNRFSHMLDDFLGNLSTKELLSFHSRLIDTEDHDCYLASEELNRLTKRGGDLIHRSQWVDIIQKLILSRPITEEDAFTPQSQTELRRNLSNSVLI